jgi:hypothetical protein
MSFDNTTKEINRWAAWSALVAALTALLLLAFCASGCAHRRYQPRPPGVSVVRAQAIETGRARHTDAARETLHHQGEVIQSSITHASTARERAKAARLAADRADAKIGVYFQYR